MIIDLKNKGVMLEENKDKGGWLIFFFLLEFFVCYLFKKFIRLYRI